MSDEKKRWYYDGPIMSDYDTLLSTRYKAYTMAPTREKAVNNIKYRYNMDNGFPKTHKIYLDSAFIFEGGPPSNLMKHEIAIEGPKTLRKEDFDEDKWACICDVFGLVDAETISLEKYILQFYGIRKENAHGS